MRRILTGAWSRHARRLLILVSLYSGPAWLRAEPPASLEVGRFSSASVGETLPAGWMPLTFSKIERHTDYTLVAEDGSVVVRAVSDRSASGLIRAISIPPDKYPVISWRWKVGNILNKGDVTRREGDDYPARIYISFAFDPQRASMLERLKHRAARLIYGEDVPYRAISYIWGSNSPAGIMTENPYTERVMMFVIRSGDTQAGQWLTERRNIRADYISAFGEEPAKISGVAIMTDTDNTRESATAWYGDIVFSEGLP